MTAMEHETMKTMTKAAASVMRSENVTARKQDEGTTTSAAVAVKHDEKTSAAVSEEENEKTRAVAEEKHDENLNPAEICGFDVVCVVLCETDSDRRCDASGELVLRDSCWVLFERKFLLKGDELFCRRLHAVSGCNSCPLSGSD